MKCPTCHSENVGGGTFCRKCGASLHPSEKPSASEISTLETALKELPVGTTFAGRYQVIEELGRGGMGRVYKAFDGSVGEKVALKLLNPEIAADTKTIERFRNVLKAARQISSRHVCRMYDLNREGGTQFITMEYVPGEDLKSSIRRIGVLNIGKALSIAGQICEGLAEAHRLGVVHRDIKPQNIMIDKEGNVRIMDFGVARSFPAKGITDPGVIIGTPEYMSPEQVEGKAADRRSDIYSLGVILYEMVTGRVPFEGDTPLSVAVKHKAEKPRDPREIDVRIPESLSRVILKCLEKEKEKRYQTAEEVRTALGEAEKDISSSVMAPPARKREATRQRRRLATLALPAIILLAAALTLAVYLFSDRVPGMGRLKEHLFGEPPTRSVAVIHFRNLTGDSAYDYLEEAIPNLLITNLEQSKYLRVTTWERMRDLLRQTGKEDVRTIDRDLGFELCRMDGVDAIVIGSFVKAGDTFATDVKVLDVETKRLLKSTSARGEGVASILKNQIDELSRDVSRGVGLKERQVEEAKIGIAYAATNSMEAYNYFLRGKEELEKFYCDDARRFLEKAVTIDPTFAVAHLYLGKAQAGLGNSNEAKAAFEKAKEYAEKATEKDRLRIDATYALVREKDQEKYLDILQKMVARYPQEKEAYCLLGSYYNSHKDTPKAIELFNQALAIDPNYGIALNGIAYAYAGQEDYDKAIAYFQRYASASPGDANPFDSMAEIYFRMGRLDEAIAKYKEALEVKPDFVADWKIGYLYALKEDYDEAMRWADRASEHASSPALKAQGAGWKAFYHFWVGRFEQSLRDLHESMDLMKGMGDEYLKSFEYGILVGTSFRRGQWAKCREYAEEEFEYEKKLMPEATLACETNRALFFALLDLQQGQNQSARVRLEEAKSGMDKMDADSRAVYAHYHDRIEAELLLAEGSADAAIATAEKISPLRLPPMSTIYMMSYNQDLPNDVVARAYAGKGDLDSAIAEYERLITVDPSRKERMLIQPRNHYRLAKLYEEKGLPDKAIAEYQKLLAIFKKADEGLPEVADARKRLAELKSRSQT